MGNWGQKTLRATSKSTSFRTDTDNPRFAVGPLTHSGVKVINSDLVVRFWKELNFIRYTDSSMTPHSCDAITIVNGLPTAIEFKNMTTIKPTTDFKRRCAKKVVCTHYNYKKYGFEIKNFIFVLNNPELLTPEIVKNHMLKMHKESNFTDLITINELKELKITVMENAEFNKAILDKKIVFTYPNSIYLKLKAILKKN